MTTLIAAPALEAEAAFLLDWSHGKPIVHAGGDTHSDRAGDWYRCGTWSVRLWPSTVVALLEAALATGTPTHFQIRRTR